MPIDEFVCRQCEDIVSARCSVQEKQAGFHLECPACGGAASDLFRRDVSLKI